MPFVVVAIGGVVAFLGTVIIVGASAVSRLELARWVADRKRAADFAVGLLEAPGRVLGTSDGLITVGTLVVGLAAASWLASVPLVMAAALLFAAIPVALAAMLTVPRAIGRRWAEWVVYAVAPWLERLSVLARPFVPLPSQRGAASAVPADDDTGADTLAGVIAFTERPAHDIMTARTEIVAVEEGASATEVATVFSESGYSRLPVYRGTLDNILGMVHAFDLLKVEQGGPLPLRPVTVTPGSRRGADLLVEMLRDRRQFAVVIDEFGGTAGIATLEDLLEELVGEILDEFDEMPVPDAPESIVLELDGGARIEDIAARFDVGVARSVETVGGLLASALGRIPRAGERVTVGGIEFDVVEATPTRVTRVLVRRAPVPTTVIAQAPGHARR